ncbi:MAG: hypothetical protein JPMHGGIA_01193 [Saprospiraceae bacterium]|jgi:hypothetical protein|nr:hypothetical protein [Saprospiraceae bacterium]
MRTPCHTKKLELLADFDDKVVLLTASQPIQMRHYGINGCRLTRALMN